MRRTFGLAAAGLLTLWSASSAKAQFTYGYDSADYCTLPSAAYYNADGYERMYTEMANGLYRAGTSEPFRGVAPYIAPPYGEFGRSDAIGDFRPTPAVTKSTPPAPKPRRRALAKAR